MCNESPYRILSPMILRSLAPSGRLCENCCLGGHFPNTDMKIHIYIYILDIPIVIDLFYYYQDDGTDLLNENPGIILSKMTFMKGH